MWEIYAFYCVTTHWHLLGVGVTLRQKRDSERNQARCRKVLTARLGHLSLRPWSDREPDSNGTDWTPRSSLVEVFYSLQHKRQKHNINSTSLLLGSNRHSTLHTSQFLTLLSAGALSPSAFAGARWNKTWDAANKHTKSRRVYDFTVSDHMLKRILSHTLSFTRTHLLVRLHPALWVGTHPPPSSSSSSAQFRSHSCNTNLSDLNDFLYLICALKI